jgi:hypothetical protein
MTKELDKDMSVIENNIHQTKNKSRQDPLNFGIRLNNRLAFLLADQQRGDFPPTDQAEEVRKELTKALDKEVNALNQLIEERTNKINQVLKERGLSILKAPAEKVVN